MAPEQTTRERLRAIDEQLEALQDMAADQDRHLEAHSGQLNELQTMAAQQAVVMRSIEAAMALGATSVSSSARWVKTTCFVVAGAVIVAAAVTVYGVLLR